METGGGGNLTFHAGEVTAQERAASLGQRGGTVWFTGLSGSGKSTVAVALEKALVARGRHAARLDGDNVRMGLCSNLGFSAEDRAENIRRIGEVAKLQAEAGLVCLASFVSPYARDRDRVAALHRGAGVPYAEVHVAVPLSVAEARDPKGLYKKARAGEIQGFTGIDDPYEEPRNPDLRLDTDTTPLPEAVERLIALLTDRGMIPAA
ncbi:adenylyl-sulfate kinase [Phycisphaera mikurensis NBRC 102666]|uniref:Adenylyl-sulfate kinase n=1 Tax=Phycisphaera mikurensis (strain NBRC 102666 / KCTC 22515 / FYK2301M01) TaxID=1142394 RepID=I0IAF8_PHYMF|nr:adenylyl-sulfate kinase [Phycisphaera mikurensis NBRC 102666]